MRKQLLKGTSGLMTLAVILIMVSTPLATADTMSQTVTPMYMITDQSIEQLNIVAGIGNAVLVNLVILGGPALYPFDVTDDALDKTSAWMFYMGDMSEYDSYLTRRPLTVPDNATLLLAYPDTYSASVSEAYALEAAYLFSEHYGISLYWFAAVHEGGQYIYGFNGPMSASAYAASITDVENFGSGGYDDLIDVMPLDTAPVSAVAYGKYTVRFGVTVPFHSALYVDANGITSVGDQFTLSTDSLFGESVDPDTTIAGYSQTMFYFPYVLNVNEIVPDTTNPVPQLTGIFKWEQRNWWSGGIGSQADLKVGFTIDGDELATWPNPQVTMGYDPSVLLNDGTLNMTYSVDNIGSETAYDIDLKYPLGRDFLEFFNNTESLPKMWVIKDEFYFDETFSTTFKLEVVASGDTEDLGVTGQTVDWLYLNGWYRNVADDELAVWDGATTEFDLGTKSFSVTLPVIGTKTVDITIKITNPDGFLSTALPELGRLRDLIDLDSIPVSDLAALQEALGAQLYTEAIKSSVVVFNDTLHAIYEQKEIMQFNFGSFALESEYIDYAQWGVPGGHTEYFLHAVIDELAPGAEASLWWAIENMPAEIDEFALPKFNLVPVLTSPDGYDSYAGNITSYAFDYLDVMQYFFAIMDFHARPMSWYYRDYAATPIDLRAIPSLQYGSQYAASIGMKFTYEDSNGFGYWGMSNGLNLQLADDEAVLISTTTLDKQVYFVGDEFTAEVAVQNIGNIDATNVHVYLVHARLGRYNNLEDVSVIYDESVGTVAAGATETVSYTDIAVSYVGYHPMLAIVTFESDADHEVEEVTDFFNIGVDEWIAGGHTYEWTTSTLTGAILLPPTDNLVPAFPQPQLEFDIDVSIISVDPTFQFTYDVTITNVGNAATDITFIQYYNDAELTLGAYSATLGNNPVHATTPVGNLRVTGIHLEPTESVTISMTFTVDEG
ncbi:MAG: hypothetical protein ACTSYA_07075, partial [Candidatus Kariarchaeaceae archaeon]